MTCKACGQGKGLEVCPHCGYHYCGNHRGTLDGGVACTGCLRQEHERKTKAKEAREKREARLAREQAQSENLPSADDLARREPELLPEPPGSLPYVAGAIAGALAGGYGYWFFSWLTPRHELPRGVAIGLAVAAAVVAALGVWAIVKTRRS